MSVLLPNAMLTVHYRAHLFARDTHGMPVAPVGVSRSVGPLPGSVQDRPESGTWTMRLQPQCHPVRAGDEVTDSTTGRRWTVVKDAQLHQVLGHGAADYVAAEATLDPPVVP